MISGARIENTRTKQIIATIEDGEDPSEAAAQAAIAHGTRVQGNMRWMPSRHNVALLHIGTVDGRGVVVHDRPIL